MKKFFEEPKLYVEQFAVTDILTASSWNGITPGDDETDFVSPFSPKNP